MDKVVNAVEELGMDGVDFAQEEGCGSSNYHCDDQSSVHLDFLRTVRQRLPDKIISYTFPASLDRPYLDVVRYGHPYVDYFQVYRTDASIISALMDTGVPREKVRQHGN